MKLDILHVKLSDELWRLIQYHWSVLQWLGGVEHLPLKIHKNNKKTTLTKEDVKQIKNAVGYQRRLKAPARWGHHLDRKQNLRDTVFVEV